VKFAALPMSALVNRVDFGLSHAVLNQLSTGRFVTQADAVGTQAARRGVARPLASVD
jgi:hypothetical protein